LPEGGQPALPQPDPLLKVFAVAHVAVEGGFHPDPPRLARAIDAPAADLAADVHDVVLGAEPFDQLRQQIDRVALGHRIEVELHAGVALHQPPAFDADLFAAHGVPIRWWTARCSVRRCTWWPTSRGSGYFSSRKEK